MTFNELVAHHLTTKKADLELTNQQLAERIGLEHGNFVSMLMRPRAKQSPMALKLVRRMCIGLGLTARQAARLLHARAKEHPEAATAVDVETLLWVVKTFNQAARDLRASEEGAAHGC